MAKDKTPAAPATPQPAAPAPTSVLMEKDGIEAEVANDGASPDIMAGQGWTLKG